MGIITTVRKVHIVREIEKKIANLPVHLKQKFIKTSKPPSNRTVLQYGT